MRFVNPQPCNGLFELRVPLFAGDLCSNLLSRLRRTEKALRRTDISVAFIFLFKFFVQ